MKVWFRIALLSLLFSPAWAEDDWHYTLRPGDTLWKVCTKFAQTPDACWRELAKHNNLNDPHSLRPGKSLQVPISWLKEKPIPARVERVNGMVTRYPAHGGEPQAVQEGAVVHFGDALETAADSSVRVRFADQSTVYIKPSSLLVVTRYRRFLSAPEPDARDSVSPAERTELHLERGEIRNYVAPQPNQEPVFEVHTPGAVAAVRGTEYSVSVDSNETTRSEVLDGAVNVSAQAETHQVNGGFATLAERGQAPIEPVPLLPAPSVAVQAGHTGVDLSWPAQQGATRYAMEWFNGENDHLLALNYATGDQWQQALPPGEYAVAVRAVDENGLKGYESRYDFAVTPAPPEVPEEPKKKWDFWLFAGAAAALLAL